MSAKNTSGGDAPGHAPAATSGGFTPAADYIEGDLDINQYLVRNALATFFFAVVGDAMRELGVSTGDILVVDRSITARHGHIVVAFIDGERLVKQLHVAGERVELRSGPGTKTIVVQEATGCDIWGVAVGKFRRIPA